ncbi:hypothetical protein HU200_003648 [Digitaria exilis]|uniref:DUF1618 domain-containing protein n=1 Tax=Digitaria exilis TaxID=1010633 RepID=A0A835FWF5_9POAL|nr:hypothetical protein HU200_003648 [Digitaria exilis]
MASSSSPPPDPHWVILGRVALVRRNSVDALGGISVAVAKPPSVSTLSVATSALRKPDDEDDTDKDRYVSAVAADASGVLLRVSDCPLVGFLDDRERDRPGTLLLASGFVPVDASQDTYFATEVVRVPDRTLPNGQQLASTCVRSLGLVPVPGSGGCEYLAAILCLTDAEKSYFSLFSFRSGTDAWMEKKLRCPSMSGWSWSSDDVIAHKGKLCWVNCNTGLLLCDPFADEVVLDHIVLPEILPQELYNIRVGGIFGVSQDKLIFVEVARSIFDPVEKTVVAIWALSDRDTRWEQRSATSLGSIWSSRSYIESKMPEKIPVLAFVHPGNADVVYFMLEQFLFSINLPEIRVIEFIKDPELVGVLSGNMPLQDSSWRYFLCWELPPWLATDAENLSMSFDDLLATLNSAEQAFELNQVEAENTDSMAMPTSTEQAREFDQVEEENTDRMALQNSTEQAHEFDHVEAEENTTDIVISVEQPDPMMFLIRLPLHFKFDQALEVSAQYNYVTTLELLDIVKKQEPIKWIIEGKKA